MKNVDRLPDCYAKGTASNNYKLLNLNEQTIADVKADAIAILNMVDLQQATGRTLDLYGDMVGQRRGSLDDIQYRYMILTKMGINVCKGDYKSVINTIKQVFNCNASDIVLEDDLENTCSVNIINFPMQILNNTIFSVEQAIEIIENILPIAVYINHANFEGTFEFSNSDTEYDETTGFGNIEQTIGGTIGTVYKRTIVN